MTRARDNANGEPLPVQPLECCDNQFIRASNSIGGIYADVWCQNCGQMLARFQASRVLSRDFVPTTNVSVRPNSASLNPAGPRADLDGR